MIMAGEKFLITNLYIPSFSSAGNSSTVLHYSKLKGAGSDFFLKQIPHCRPNVLMDQVAIIETTRTSLLL